MTRGAKSNIVEVEWNGKESILYATSNLLLWRWVISSYSKINFWGGITFMVGHRRHFWVGSGPFVYPVPPSSNILNQSKNSLYWRGYLFLGRKGVLSEWEVVVKSLSYILHQLMYLSISKYLDVFKNVLIHPKIYI